LQEGCEWRAPPATATLERVRARRWDIYCDEIVLGKTPVELEHLALLPHHSSIDPRIEESDVRRAELKT